MSDMQDAFRKVGYQDPRQSNRGPRRSAQATAAADVPTDYTDKADRLIKDLQRSMGRNYSNFTTSKLRKILSMVNEIYNDVLIEPSEELSPKLQSRIEYLKVRLVYECGREPNVIKPFVEKAELLPIINGIGNSRKKFIDFARYMEALVAYHRFHGGRD